MDPNTVVLEISSDEDVDWNDHDGSGIADGGDDHNWLTEILDEVSKENCSDDSDEVVFVSEVSPAKKSKLKSFSFDLDDDCVVLDDDPDKAVDVRNENRSDGNDDSDDVLVVSEKGQVACRDYPHPRHLCIKFPFSATPNQSHCAQCYCYVCDSLAPCVYWGDGSASMDHCHATDKDEFWTLERKNAKICRKGVQLIPKVADASLGNQLPSMDFHRPAPALVQPHNQVPCLGSVYAQRTLANFQPPNIINQNRIPVLASRNKFHQDSVSQLLLRTNGVRGHPNYKLGAQPHRPVFKRAGPVGVATTATRHAYRGNLGNPSRQQNYNVNGMLPGPNKYLGSLQSTEVNVSVSYPCQSQNLASSPQLDQPLLPQPVISHHLPNPNFKSQENPNPFPLNPLYQPHLVPSSSRPQLASCQPSYMVPAQLSYPVPSQAQVHIPSIPVSGQTHEGNPVLGQSHEGNPVSGQTHEGNPVLGQTHVGNPVLGHTHEGNQAQIPTVDQSFKDFGFSWTPSQHCVTPEGNGPSDEPSSLAAVSSSLAEYRYDWIFEDQPIEPGFMDIPGPYGLNEFSSDSAFIDTGPIFEF